MKYIYSEGNSAILNSPMETIDGVVYSNTNIVLGVMLSMFLYHYFPYKHLIDDRGNIKDEKLYIEEIKKEMSDFSLIEKESFELCNTRIAKTISSERFTELREELTKKALSMISIHKNIVISH